MNQKNSEYYQNTRKRLEAHSKMSLVEQKLDVINFSELIRNEKFYMNLFRQASDLNSQCSENIRTDQSIFSGVDSKIHAIPGSEYSIMSSIATINSSQKIFGNVDEELSFIQKENIASLSADEEQEDQQLKNYRTKETNFTENQSIDEPHHEKIPSPTRKYKKIQEDMCLNLVILDNGKYSRSGSVPKIINRQHHSSQRRFFNVYYNPNSDKNNHKTLSN